MPKPIVDCLLDNAYQDAQVLLVNEKEGDQFAVARDVEFIFRSRDKAKAETVRNFIEDNHLCRFDGSRPKWSTVGATGYNSHAPSSGCALLRLRTDGLPRSNL
jgi:hypothetical protein